MSTVKILKAMVIKHSVAWGLLFLLTPWLGVYGCSKQSAVEGKLVDWNGEPVAGVKILASQVQPIKGYEQFEAETNLDGTFRIKGLFPSSQYVLRPSSDKWTCETAVMVNGAPQDETAILPSSMKIDRAYSKSGESLVEDLVTGATRYQITSDGLIADSRTDLEWIVGPDRPTTFYEAELWVMAQAKYGLRMPKKEELKQLYTDRVGSFNMDPIFKTTGYWVWAEPYDSKSAWAFMFNRGIFGRDSRSIRSHETRVFGVRTHQHE